MKNNNVQTTWRISLVYALLASFWLFVANRLLGPLVPDPQQATWLATYQDVLFVTVTTLLVYALVWRALRAPWPGWDPRNDRRNGTWKCTMGCKDAPTVGRKQQLATPDRCPSATTNTG